MLTSGKVPGPPLPASPYCKRLYTGWELRNEDRYLSTNDMLNEVESPDPSFSFYWYYCCMYISVINLRASIFGSPYMVCCKHHPTSYLHSESFPAPHPFFRSLQHWKAGRDPGNEDIYTCHHLSCARIISAMTGHHT